MLNTFLYRWRTLTRKQQLFVAALVLLILYAIISGTGRLAPAILLANAVILLIALPIHEFSHAAMATALGDDTPRRQGRLTLNPVAHLDVLGAALIFLAGFGWGKAVEWNPNRVKIDKKLATILVALAGPVSNLLLAALAVFLISSGLIPGAFLASFLYWFAYTNVALFVFNLIPVPPLDGSHVLFALWRGDNYGLRWQLQQYGVWILLVILLFAGPVVQGMTYAILEGLTKIV